jgi:hypothetical protein
MTLILSLGEEGEEDGEKGNMLLLKQRGEGVCFVIMVKVLMNIGRKIVLHDL